jgi:hypothetical protein
MEGWNTTWLGMLNTTLMDAQKFQEVVDSQRKLITEKDIFLDIHKIDVRTKLYFELKTFSLNSS